MSQLTFDFNASAPPVRSSVSPAPFPPSVEKKSRPKQIVYRDWERLLWVTGFLSPDVRAAALVILGWCRTVDSLSRIQPIDELKERIFSSKDSANEDPVFGDFYRVLKRYSIPIEYPISFLDGITMENPDQRYETLEDLFIYAHRVSGCVALMMAHVTGLSHPGALKNACDLGLAAQLTSTARNVREDFEKGRIFLPVSWLREEGVAPEDLFIPRNRTAVWKTVVRLLGVADRLYASADIGFQFLPFRAALAVAAARQIHSQSGRRLIDIGSGALDCPVVASPLRERMAALVGAGRVLPQIPARTRLPWKRVPIHLVWERT